MSFFLYVADNLASCSSCASLSPVRSISGSGNKDRAVDERSIMLVYTFSFRNKGRVVQKMLRDVQRLHVGPSDSSGDSPIDMALLGQPFFYTWPFHCPSLHSSFSLKPRAKNGSPATCDLSQPWLVLCSSELAKKPLRSTLLEED